jgi:uncharacterized metal-binding protein YceD (DUF177 family)
MNPEPVLSMTKPVHMATWKVKANEIPEAGLTVSRSFDPVGLNLQTPTLKFISGPSVTATFQKERDTVFVNVVAPGKMELLCGRCLGTYARSYDGHFGLDYPVKERDVLEITDDVRQEVLLSYPIQFVCQEGCKGLCPCCGANLNEGECHGIT